MKNWSIASLNQSIANMYAIGSADKWYGGGRPRTARTTENVDAVDTLVLSQET